MAGDRALQQLPGGADPRVGGVEVDLEALGDLGHRHALDVGEDEGHALVLVEGVEGAAQDGGGLTAGDFLVGGGADVAVGEVEGEFAARALPVSAGDAARDPVKESADRAAGVELVAATMEDDEDVLDRVVDGRRGDAEAAGDAPDEVVIITKELGDRGQGSGARTLAGEGVAEGRERDEGRRDAL